MLVFCIKTLCKPRHACTLIQIKSYLIKTCSSILVALASTSGHVVYTMNNNLYSCRRAQVEQNQIDGNDWTRSSSIVWFPCLQMKRQPRKFIVAIIYHNLYCARVGGWRVALDLCIPFVPLNLLFLLSLHTHAHSEAIMPCHVHNAFLTHRWKNVC